MIRSVSRPGEPGDRGKSAEIRRNGDAETLKRRDPREFAGPLIERLRQPIVFTVKRVEGPGKPGELWVRGDRYDRKRLYQSTPLPDVVAGPGDVVTRDADGNKVVVRNVGTSIRDVSRGVISSPSNKPAPIPRRWPWLIPSPR